jgi:ligand-binding sensor domain-containing protein
MRTDRIVSHLLGGRILKACLFLVFGLSCSAAFDSDRTIAQFRHTSWGPKEGAPTVVRALAQTADGYLWIASHDGLYRFESSVHTFRLDV